MCIFLWLTKTHFISYINIACNEPFITIMNNILKTCYNQILSFLPWVLIKSNFCILYCNLICWIKMCYKIYIWLLKFYCGLLPIIKIVICIIIEYNLIILLLILCYNFINYNLTNAWKLLMYLFLIIWNHAESYHSTNTVFLVVMLMSVVGGVFIVFALMALCYRSVVVHKNFSLCLRLVSRKQISSR